MLTFTRAQRIWRWLRRGLYLAIALLLLWQASILGRVWWWVDHNPDSTAFMRAQQSALEKKSASAKLKQQWTAYANISRNLKRAVIAAEDTAFVEHDGFDWEGMERAWERNKKTGKVVAGGSTITQQLAKNLFLSSEKSYTRKAHEALITAELEWLMDKERILEIYLNVVEWGEGVFGAEAAARHYFNTSADKLTPDQAAKLAAMLPRPRFYDKNRNSRYLQGRTAIIAQRMRQVEIP